MTVSLPPEIVEQRSDEREVFALINALRNANAGGIGPFTVGGGLTFTAGVLDRAALTGDITAPQGVNVTTFRSFAARSVLGRAPGSAGIPTEISSITDGDVLRQAAGALGFGGIPGASVGLTATQIAFGSAGNTITSEAALAYIAGTNTLNLDGTIIEKAPRTDVRAFGAVGDGVTDDTAAVQAALDASTNVYFPGGFNFVVSNLTVTTDGTRIFGDGVTSIVTMKGGATGAMITGGAHRITVENLTLFGGITTSMKAVAVLGTRTGLEFNSNVNSRIDGVTVHGFSLVGLSYVPVGSDRLSHATVISCTLFNNWMALNVQTSSGEYLRNANLDVHNNYYGVIIKAGNVFTYGCKINDNAFGAYVYGTGNPNNGHGNFNCCLINHNTTNIYCEDITIGYNFVGNNVFEGPIVLTNCTGINIIDGILDVTSYTFTGGGNNYIRNNYIQNGYANAVTHAGDSTLMIDNYINGGTFVDSNRNLYAAASPATGAVTYGSGTANKLTSGNLIYNAGAAILTLAGAAGGYLTGGTASGNPLTLISNAINDGKIFLGNNTTNWFNEAASGSQTKFNIGAGNDTHTNTIASFNRNADEGTYITISNASAGASANMGFAIAQSLSAFTPNYMLFNLQGSGFATQNDTTANSAVFQLINATGAPIIISNYSTGDILLATGATGWNGTVRLRVANGGNVSIANLTAGGIAYATAATGVLKIGTSAEVAGAITWPAANRVLFSSGTTTAPIGNSAFQFDDSTRVLFMGAGASQKWANLGNFGDANTEYIESAWAGNVWTLASKKTGTGTVRPMVIDADTSTLTLAGDAGWSLTSTSVAVTAETGGTGHNLTIIGNNSDGQLFVDDWFQIAFLTGGASNSSVLMDYSQPGIQLSTSPTIASGAAAVFDGIDLSTSVSISDTTTIATATGFNAVNVDQPTYAKSGAGSVIVTNAATFYIANAPQVGANVTITNKWALWVDQGISRFDGNGTFVFELPADATGNVSAATGRIPCTIGGATKYIRYYND